MKTGIYLSYVGLGANLLHLSYCHEIAKKYGPVTIITLCKNLEETLAHDPLIKEVHYLNKYHKKLIDIFNLSKFLKKFNFTNLIIFYPSLRISLAAKITGIKNILSYPFFSKKNLHLVDAAKSLTEKFLKIENCKTETSFCFDENSIQNIKKNFNKESYKIVIGAGSSGPTTRWGAENFANLINQLNENGDYFFFILCGPNEKEVEEKILIQLKKKNYLTLSDKRIKDVIPYLCISNMYVGNDSFGSHITSQSNIKSVVILLDSPKAYTDYSKNFYRISPPGIDLNNITHGTSANPDLIKVDEVIKLINQIKD